MNYLGIDYGKKFIGIAFSHGQMAQGLTTLHASQAETEIPYLVKKHHIDSIVIGLPEGPLADEVKKFGLDLEKKLGKRVSFIDETLTSVEVTHAASPHSQKNRRLSQHQNAAAVLLQRYLDAL